MNYRHAFHAGNFADVLKHCVLVALIEALQRKASPFCYIETHAGRGRYDLRASEAQRSPEYIDGIERLLRRTQAMPAPLQRYIDLVRGTNREGAGDPAVYPGSPLIANRMLRSFDRALLCEIEAGEAAALKLLFRDDARVAVHQRDGYLALNALLPPRPRRGLVLIDPPFEQQESEFAQVQDALELALGRWPIGIYAVWYPIKLQRVRTPFRRWLAGLSDSHEILIVELLVRPPRSALRLNGAGMAIVNPPWCFEQDLRGLLPNLLRALDQGGGQYRIDRAGRCA